MENPGSNEIGSIESKDYYAVMTHFYRGELGRIMVWRQRLDVTTNWAVVGTTAMITFGLGAKDHTPLIFMFANLLVFLLLTIEARRYRYYDAFRARVRMLEEMGLVSGETALEAFRARVRMLEAHIIMPVMMREKKLLQGDWKQVMAEDLLLPSFKMSRLKAMLRRLRRNYVWIFLMIAVGWFIKVWIHYPESHSVGGFLENMAPHHPLPQEVFWGLTGVFYTALLAMVIGSLLMEKGSGEFSTRPMRRKKWLS